MNEPKKVRYDSRCSTDVCLKALWDVYCNGMSKDEIEKIIKNGAWNDKKVAERMKEIEEDEKEKELLAKAEKKAARAKKKQKLTESDDISAATESHSSAMKDDAIKQKVQEALKDALPEFTRNMMANMATMMKGTTRECVD